MTELAPDIAVPTAGTSLLVGCVADTSQKYLDQALRLLQSWRWFAGAYASTNFHICVLGEIAAGYRSAYDRYGATVHLVKRFSVRHPPSNKLRFLELPEVHKVDRVLLLDCDTIVVQEPNALFEPSVEFAAKIADAPTVTLETFATLFAAFELPLPAPDQRCTVGGEATIPYFNAGVLCFSRHAVATLVPEWIRLNHKLIDRMELLADAANFCEQASLSLALVSCKTPFRVLANDMNFPSHFVEQDLESSFANIDPKIIHYHWQATESGFLTSSPYPLVEARIRQFNNRLRIERGSVILGNATSR